MKINGLTFLLSGLILLFSLHDIDSQPANQPVEAVQMSSGKKVYLQKCLTCHQFNGRGVPRMAPTLSGTSYVLGDKSRLIGIILNGFNEDVEIEGEYFSNSMPSFNTLSDEEIADVLTYVRNSFNNKASAVTVDEVSKEREKIK